MSKFRCPQGHAKRYARKPCRRCADIKRLAELRRSRKAIDAKHRQYWRALSREMLK